MQCLIDADVLLHELGWSGEFKDKETGENVLLPFEAVAELLDKKIKLIEYECEATEPSILFITESEKIVEMYNKNSFSPCPLIFTPNFRYEMGKTKPYKGTRNNPKPFHFYNIVAYLMANYSVIVSQDGLEADDEICITARYMGEGYTICSRDKDLRICPGWHYSWECGKQAAMGPHYTDVEGSLHKKDNGDVYGYGMKFFFFQMLTGDAADNIPGLPGVGKAKAYNLLHDKDYKQCLNIVKDLYKEKMGEESKNYFLEQGNLLWIRQEHDTPFDIRRL